MKLKSLNTHPAAVVLVEALATATHISVPTRALDPFPRVTLMTATTVASDTRNGRLSATESSDLRLDH
jgi:hypothetical protein